MKAEGSPEPVNPAGTPSRSQQDGVSPSRRQQGRSIRFPGSCLLLQCQALLSHWNEKLQDSTPDGAAPLRFRPNPGLAEKPGGRAAAAGGPGCKYHKYQSSGSDICQFPFIKSHILQELS